MKSHSILLTFLMLFASAGIISAQENPPDYYTGKTRVTGEGYTYNITNFNNTWIRVDNELNTLTDTKPPQLPEWLWWSISHILNKDAEAFFMSIASDEVKALSQEFRNERMKPGPDGLYFDNFISAMFSFNPRTGEIYELYFNIKNSPASKAIHPDKLYKLEQYIKKHVKVYADSFDSQSVGRELVKY